MSYRRELTFDGLELEHDSTALAGELVLELHPESFESLLDAVRMTG